MDQIHQQLNQQTSRFEVEVVEMNASLWVFLPLIPRISVVLIVDESGPRKSCLIVYEAVFQKIFKLRQDAQIQLLSFNLNLAIYLFIYSHSKVHNNTKEIIEQTK